MASIKTKFTVGLFVLVGFGIAFIGIVWIGMSDYFEKGAHYTAFFDESVQGLEKDSSVKYRGVSIGRVESISVAPDATLIQIVMKIEKGLKLDVQREVIVAQLKSVGITGIMFVELDRKKPTDPDLSPKLSFDPKYPAIATKPSGITKLLKGIEDIIAQLNSLDIGGISIRLKASLDRINQAVEDVKLKEISSNIITSLEKVENLLNNKTWDKLMVSIESSGTSIQTLTDNANKTVSGIGSTITRFDKLFAKNEKKLSESINEIESIMKNANSFLEEGAKLLKGGDVQISNLNHRLSLVLENFEIASDNLNRLIEIVAEQPSQLIFAKPPPLREIEP